MSHWYYLESPIQWVDDDFLDEEWFAWALDESEMCCGLGCGSVRPQYYGTPIDVPVLRRPKGHEHPAPMVSIVSQKLADVLAPHLRDAVWGRCMIGNIPLESHVTIYTPADSSAISRGGEGTRYRRCRWCGLERIGRPSRWSTEEWCELPPLLADHYAAHLAGHGGFIVTEEIRDQLIEFTFEGFELVPQEVRFRGK